MLWINLIRINPVIKPNQRSKKSFFQYRFLAMKSSNDHRVIVIKTTIRTAPTNDRSECPQRSSFARHSKSISRIFSESPTRPFLFDPKHRNSSQRTNATSNMSNHTARAILIRTATKDEKLLPNNKDIKPHPHYQKVKLRYVEEAEERKGIVF